MENYGAALSDFNKAIELEKSNASYFKGRANVKYRLNDASACEDWQQAANLGDTKSAFFIKQYCK